MAESTPLPSSRTLPHLDGVVSDAIDQTRPHKVLHGHELLSPAVLSAGECFKQLAHARAEEHVVLKRAQVHRPALQGRLGLR
jgi:hypothetical protein